MIHTGQYLPILWCHGTSDIDIPETYGQDAFHFLRSMLHIPERCLNYRQYEGQGHIISDAELEDVASWLMAILR